MRWRPLPPDSQRGGQEGATFFESLFTICGSGEAAQKSGVAIHMYHCDLSAMTSARQAFVNSDGDMLVVPQEGTLCVTTEMGVLEVGRLFCRLVAWLTGCLAVWLFWLYGCLVVWLLLCLVAWLLGCWLRCMPPSLKSRHSQVPAGHICVLPRGIRISVDAAQASRGYVLEVYKGHFEIPSLGPIGANG